MTKKSQSGYYLLSFILTLALAAGAMAYKVRQQTNDAQVAAGNAEATVLIALQTAGNTLYADAASTFAAGSPYTKNGVTLTLQTISGVPQYAGTLSDLITMGFMPAGWTTVQTSALNSQPYKFRVTRTPAGCVATACAMSGLIWLDGPILNVRNQSGTTNGPAIGAILTKIGADAGTSYLSTPTLITGFGGNWTLTNVVTAQPAGVVAVQFGPTNTSNHLIVGDPRDPNFQGTTTIAGPTRINNNMTVTGSLSAGTLTLGLCASIDGATGRAGFGCANRNDIPAGYTGGVRSPDVVAGSNVLVSSAPGSFTGSNGNYAILTSNNGSGSAEVRTSGRVQSDRFVPSGSYSEGSACTEEGAYAKRTGGGAVICMSGVWNRLSAQASVNAACSPEGIGAQTSAGIMLVCTGGTYKQVSSFFQVATIGAACTSEGMVAYNFDGSGVPNQTLVCRRNNASLGGAARWFRMQDITSNLAFVQTYEATHLAVVTKPSCPVASGQSVTPLIQIRGKTETSTDGGFARYAVDNGASWTVYLLNGAGTPLLSSSGNAVALADVYCFYV